MSDITWSDLAKVYKKIVTKKPIAYRCVIRPAIYRWLMIYKRKKWHNKFLAWEAAYK